MGQTGAATLATCPMVATSAAGTPAATGSHPALGHTESTVGGHKPTMQAPHGATWAQQELPPWLGAARAGGCQCGQGHWGWHHTDSGGRARQQGMAWAAAGAAAPLPVGAWVAGWGEQELCGQ